MTSRAVMRTAGPRRRRAGFSLLEMLIAIGLIVALLGSMFGFLWDMLATRRQVIDTAARRRAATLFIDRLERDLLTALVGDEALGAGINGNPTSVRVLSRGVPVRLAERGPRPEVFADLERAEYRFVAAQRVLKVGRGSVPGPVNATVDLGGAVSRVRFRYHDGSAWRDEFDSLAADRLPVAVEVAIWYDPWPEDLEGAGEGGDEPAATGETERRTFDAGAGFDESAFAEESDLDTEVPRPDRVRVIAIPDGGEA